MKPLLRHQPIKEVPTAESNIIQYIPLITTIITVVFGATVFDSIYDFFNRPDISIKVIPNIENDGTKALITVRNIGNIAVSNLSIFIKSPNKIMNITNEYSSVELQLPEIDNTLLEQNSRRGINSYFVEIKTLKFPSGTGSIINLKLDTQGNIHNHTSNYIVTGIYDQGSSYGYVEQPIYRQILDNVLKFLTWLYYIFIVNLYIIPSLLIIILLIVYYRRKVHYMLKKE